MKDPLLASTEDGLVLDTVGTGGEEEVSAVDWEETLPAAASETLAAGTWVSRLAGAGAEFSTALDWLRLGMAITEGLMVKAALEEVPLAALTVTLAVPAVAIRLAGTAAVS